MSRVAVIQRPPVFLNKAETIGTAVSIVREVAGAGARLIVFPEAFIPGYPAWIWRLRSGADRTRGSLSRRAGPCTCIRRAPTDPAGSAARKAGDRRP
jgi:nitrilase